MDGSCRCPACCADHVAAAPPPHPPSPPLNENEPVAAVAFALPFSGSSSRPRGHFLQFNTKCILNSHQQLLQLLCEQNILTACILGAKLTDATTLPAFPNCAVLRKDRSRGRGGGPITLVHHSVIYEAVQLDGLFPGDTIAEHQTSMVEVDGVHLKVCNVYIPPASSCPPGYSPSFNSLFDVTGDVLIMGDFNARDALRYSFTDDVAAANRGRDIVEALDSTTLMVINQDSQTRVPTSGPTSSPDLTITNSHLGLNDGWVPKTTLNSNYHPILIDLDGWFAEPPPAGLFCYTNFRKANWPRFTSESERAFDRIPPPTSCATGERVFRDILLRASRRNIPRGRIPNFTPGLTLYAREMITEMVEFRTVDPTD